MAPPRIRKVFSGFAPDLQIDLKGPCIGGETYHPWVYPTYEICIPAYVWNKYSINGSSVGWTNATQSSDIESLLRRPNLQRSTDLEFGLRHRKAREGRPHSPSLGHPCPGAGSSKHNEKYPYDWVSAPRPTPPDTS